MNLTQSYLIRKPRWFNYGREGPVVPPRMGWRRLWVRPSNKVKINGSVVGLLILVRIQWNIHTNPHEVCIAYQKLQAPLSSFLCLNKQPQFYVFHLPFLFPVISHNPWNLSNLHFFLLVLGPQLFIRDLLEINFGPTID